MVSLVFKEPPTVTSYRSAVLPPGGEIQPTGQKQSGVLCPNSLQRGSVWGYGQTQQLQPRLQVSHVSLFSLYALESVQVLTRD